MKRVFKVKNQLKRSPGIYKISCTKTDKIYIGETVNLSQRLQKHFSLLRKNKHSNPILQNIFNKYGENTFEVEVLEYLDITDEIELKKIEKSWQNKFDNCIALDSNVIFHIERSEEWKESQRKILDEQRKKSIEICSIPCYIYNIETKELIAYKSLTEVEQFVERKHIDRNLSGILTPYDKKYVVFKQEGFNKDILKDIIIINDKNIKYTSIKNLCVLYNLLNDTYKKFASKTQWSLEFTGKRNTALYNKMLNENLIDFCFRSVVHPKNKESFLQMNINLMPKFTKTKINVNLWYNSLLKAKSSIALSEMTGINRSTIGDVLNNRGVIEWVRLIETVLNLLPD